MTQNYLPSDHASYPKTSATRRFMVECALKHAEAYKEQMKKLGKEDKMQKKALAIQTHMAEHCATFAAMGYAANSMTEQMARREALLNQNPWVLEPYRNALTSLPDDERFAFLQVAHAHWLLHNAFLDQHIAKLTAEGAKPENTFDDRIILGTVYTITREWRAWWKENGTLPFDTWTYEDSPWEV